MAPATATVYIGSEREAARPRVPGGHPAIEAQAQLLSVHEYTQHHGEHGLRDLLLVDAAEAEGVAPGDLVAMRRPDDAPGAAFEVLEREDRGEGRALLTCREPFDHGGRAREQAENSGRYVAMLREQERAARERHHAERTRDAAAAVIADRVKAAAHEMGDEDPDRLCRLAHAVSELRPGALPDLLARAARLAANDAA